MTRLARLFTSTAGSAVLAASLSTGCGGGSTENSESANESADESTSDGGGSGGQCGNNPGDQFFYDPPGECYNNAGCDSCWCLTYQDSPPDPTAVCQDAPATAGSITITATTLDFPSGVAVGGATVKVYAATQLAILGLEGAAVDAETTSDASGRVDFAALMPNDPIGIVAGLSATGYPDSATGLAANDVPYEAGNSVHDLFLVPASVLDDYNTELAGDPAFAPFLPIGEAGGVVGLCRNRYTGDPTAGVTVVSKTNGAASSAEVRYLQTNGTFDTNGTSETGVFVIVGPDLAEEFEAELDGAIVSTRPNKAGSSAGGVFVMNLSLDIDPGSDPFGG